MIEKLQFDSPLTNSGHYQTNPHRYFNIEPGWLYRACACGLAWRADSLDERDDVETLVRHHS